MLLVALKNCMNVHPHPQELYNSEHMDMSPTRRYCITYTVPWQPHYRYSLIILLYPFIEGFN